MSKVKFPLFATDDDWRVTIISVGNESSAFPDSKMREVFLRLKEQYEKVTGSKLE